MAPTLSSSIANFTASLIGIAASLLNSILAVFQAIFALGCNIFNSAFLVVKHVIAMFVDLFHGIGGFVAGNFLAIAVVGILYWLNTTNQRKGTLSKKS